MSLEIKNVGFSYGKHRVLEDVSFKVEYGELLSVLGPNGVGKSTLFRCMLGLLRPDSGDAYIEGESVAKMTAKELALRIAYIPQSHYPSFNFSVYDMVLMGTTSQISGIGTPGAAQSKQTERALERLGIAHLRDRGYTNISGGERQLTLIARAIVQQARILVMDEPSANLDYGNRLRVMRTVRELAEEGYAVIQSTHDPDQAYLYSDRILAMLDGRVAAWGTPKETVCDELISRLYGVDVEVCSLHGDDVRVCVPRKNS